MELPYKMYGECSQCGTKAAVVRDLDDGWNSGNLWLFYRGLPLTVNTIRANLGMAADSGEPKAMINLTTNFVCTLLMGGRRGMKPVLAAVQTALQI